MPIRPGRAKGATLTIGSSSGATFYDTGNWTPQVFFGDPQAAVGITYGQQTGSYTRLANMVFAQGRIRLTSKGSSTGGASINLPIPAVANEGGGGHAVNWLNMFSITNMIVFRYNSTFSSPSLYFQLAYGNLTGTNTNDATNNEFTNTSEFLFYINYRYA